MTVNQVSGMKAIEILISELNQDPSNARKHDKENISAIKSSLAMFGQQKPIVVGKNNVILAGNGMMSAAVALGWDKVWCVRTDLSGADAIAYGIADNRTGDLSEFDGIVLTQLLEELGDELVVAAGYDIDELLKQTTDEDCKSLESDDLQYRVVVDCRSEQHQEEVAAMVREEGLECRKLIS